MKERVQKEARFIGRLFVEIGKMFKEWLKGLVFNNDPHDARLVLILIFLACVLVLCISTPGREKASNGSAKNTTSSTAVRTIEVDPVVPDTPEHPTPPRVRFLDEADGQGHYYDEPVAEEDGSAPSEEPS